MLMTKMLCEPCFSSYNSWNEILPFFLGGGCKWQVCRTVGLFYVLNEIKTLANNISASVFQVRKELNEEAHSLDKVGSGGLHFC